MKKLFSLVSLAVLVLTVGCSEDQTTDQPIAKQGTLRATAEESTRTALRRTNVVWSLNDKLAVLTADVPTTIEEYTLVSRPGTTTGTFSGNLLTGSGDVYAFYPYNANISFVEGVFNFTLPATQKFIDHSFSNNALPMVSRSATAGELQFKNLMGVVKLTVHGHTVSSLTVTTAGEKIAGMASVAMNYTDAPELVMDASGTTSITLTEVYGGAYMPFFIAMPAGEYAAGMKFELKDNKGAVIWSITTAKTLIVNRSMVASLTPIDARNFPDDKFRSLLVDTYGLVETANGADIDINNKANIEKFKTITKIECSEQRLTSLKGIEYFTALETLICNNNYLTSFDVSKNTKLATLNCYSNQLTTLDISGCAELTTLKCFHNKLTSLDVTEFAKLDTLECYHNQLLSLDVRKNTKLHLLNCFNTGLTTLDVTENKELKTFICYENSLTSLDVTENKELIWLNCSHNQLTELDVTENKKLTGLDCTYNQLTRLDVNQYPILTELYCHHNYLTSLNLSGYAVLKTLHCAFTKMTDLDISENTQITSLLCGYQFPKSTLYETMTLWCNQTQFDSTLGTLQDDRANDYVKKVLKQ